MSGGPGSIGDNRPEAAAAAKIRVASNLRRFNTDLANSIDHVPLASSSGRIARLLRIVRECYRADVVFINASPALTLEVCVARTILPGSRCRIICADPMLNLPRGRWPRIKAAWKRLLFRKVSRFILLQHEYSAYQRYYGIDPQRVVHVPFKVNHLERILRIAARESDYYFACGVTHRDWDTLAEAWRGIRMPLIISVPTEEELRAWGMHTRLPRREAFGHEVRIVRNTSEEWLELLAGARGLILPILPDSINPSGISTYLSAFALRKPVVVSRGPSTIGLLSDEVAHVVPPADPDALCAAIRRLESDPQHRRRMGENAFAYAMRCGDQSRLHTNFLKEAFRVAGREVQTSTGG